MRTPTCASLALNGRKTWPQAFPLPRTAALGPLCALRMFRLDFTADESARTITLTALRSGYLPEELAEPDDPYADKALHRAFASHAP